MLCIWLFLIYLTPIIPTPLITLLFSHRISICWVPRELNPPWPNMWQINYFVILSGGSTDTQSSLIVLKLIVHFIYSNRLPLLLYWRTKLLQLAIAEVYHFSGWCVVCPYFFREPLYNPPSLFLTSWPRIKLKLSYEASLYLRGLLTPPNDVSGPVCVGIVQYEQLHASEIIQLVLLSPATTRNLI